MLIEVVGSFLSWNPVFDVLALHLLDDLDRVIHDRV